MCVLVNSANISINLCTEADYKHSYRWKYFAGTCKFEMGFWIRGTSVIG